MLASVLLFIAQGEEEVKVKNAGKDCWAPCGLRGGYCSWCGAGNACCRAGWQGYPPECKRAISFATESTHTCVAIQQVTVADVKMGIVMIGSISTVMMLYYLINFPDVDMRKYTYTILGETASIFCAVLAYSCVNQMAEEWLLRGCKLKAVIGFRMLLYAAFYFLGFIILMKVSGLIFTSVEEQKKIAEDHDHRARVQNTLIQCTILAHMAGFAGIGFWTTVQTRVYPFFISPFYSFLVFPAACIAAVAFIFISSFGRHLLIERWKEKTKHDIEELCDLWNESVEDAEHDTLGLFAAFLIVQSIRFYIGGILPGEDGYEGPALFSHKVREATYLYMVATCFLAVLLCFIAIRERSAMKESEKPEADDSTEKQPLPQYQQPIQCQQQRFVNAQPNQVVARGPAAGALAAPLLNPPRPGGPPRSASSAYAPKAAQLMPPSVPTPPKAKTSLRQPSAKAVPPGRPAVTAGAPSRPAATTGAAAANKFIADHLPVLGRRNLSAKARFRKRIILFRGLATIRCMISMCFAWSCFFATQWLVASWRLSGRDPTVVGIVTAILLSYVVFVLIRILDKAADSHFMGNLGERAVRRVISSFSILIGFSWEKSFDTSVEVVSSYVTAEPLSTKVGLGLLAMFVIMPAWRRWIIPMTEEHGYRFGFVPRKVVNRIEGMLEREEEGGVRRLHEYEMALRKLVSVKDGKYFRLLVTAERRMSGGPVDPHEVDVELDS